jgi:hypothetical protein
LQALAMNAEGVGRCNWKRASRYVPGKAGCRTPPSRKDRTTAFRLEGKGKELLKDCWEGKEGE